MRLPKLYHTRQEGELVKQGISITDEPRSVILIHFRVWRCIIYFRKRNKNLFDPGTRIYLYDISWIPFRFKNGYERITGSLKYSFDRNVLNIFGEDYTLEHLEWELRKCKKE